MIRKLKTKFIALTMISLFVLLFVIVTGMNVMNFTSVVNEADEILSVLASNKGSFPSFDNIFPWDISPETPYESRYFSVYLSYSGAIINTDTSQIVSVDPSCAVDYAIKVIESGEYSGFVDEFRFTVYSELGGYRIIFLDCARSLDAFNSFLTASIVMSLIGYFIVFVFVFIFSGKIIRPIALAHEKQKQFIADAGHEIRTPLTIINANVDVLEMEIGENESLSDIHQQTDRIKNLTNNLVMLARMEDAQKTMQKIEFPVSEIVADAARPFEILALQQGKDFICNVQPMLTLYGNDSAIQQLVSIFMDNALKYSPSGSTVTLELKQQNKNIVLSVENSTQTEIDKSDLKFVFDRFYRTDSSRNSETGGQGIGLSIAKSIVQAHNGKIKALSADKYSFCVTATFPVV